jgi:RNA polymerase sigma-70 factor (ECF subfamily)
MRERIADDRVSSVPDRMRTELVALLPRLRRYARTLTRTVHDADDLVQLAVERALTRHAQWQPGSRLDAWLFGILRNAWLDELRARGRRSTVFAPEEAGEHVGEAVMDREIEMMAVHAALARLPEEQRSAIALVLIEGLSYKEAAEAMDVPIGTLTSRLARGRDALQAILERGGGE